MKISIKVWRRVVETVMGSRVLPSPGCRVAQTALGQILSVRSGGLWRHPWWTQVRWEEGRWIAAPKAGFINGRAPRARMAAKDAPRATVARMEAREGGIDPEMMLEVPLYDGISYPLMFRPVGWDGAPTEEVPEFFRVRGVAPARRGVLDDIAAGRARNIGEEMPPKGLRLLRVCDLVLVVPRTAITSHTDVGAPTLDGWSIRQHLGITPTPSEPIRLRAVRQFMPTPSMQLSPSIFDSVYEEAGTDELIIATVYLLSPEGVAPESEPDGAWEPFVRHYAFWNLNWAQPPIALRPPPEPLRLDVPLAAGVGQGVISGMLSAVNDGYAAMANYLSAHSLAGRFWSV